MFFVFMCFCFNVFTNDDESSVLVHRISQQLKEV
jgi:hypothetical protein